MIKSISTFRTELMGFAIIWVILFHYGEIPFINTITSIGYGGVDIFFFLSGFGLYFSSLKEQSKLSFYRKRITRILPTYMIIVALIMIITDVFSFRQYLINISTIGFWTGHGSFEWYIPSLFMFYIIYPFLHKKFKEHGTLIVLASIFTTALLVSINLYLGIEKLPMLFITRIPVFFIGVVFANLLLKENKSEHIKLPYVLILNATGFIVLFLFKNYFPGSLWSHGLYWYPFILIAPTLCILLATLLKKLNSKHLNTVLRFFGLLSLELYLLHIKLFENSEKISQHIGLPKSIVLIAIIALIIPIAFILNKFISLIPFKKIFKSH